MATHISHAQFLLGHGATTLEKARGWIGRLADPKRVLVEEFEEGLAHCCPQMGQQPLLGRLRVDLGTLLRGRLHSGEVDLRRCTHAVQQKIIDSSEVEWRLNQEPRPRQLCLGTLLRSLVDFCSASKPPLPEPLRRDLEAEFATDCARADLGLVRLAEAVRKGIIGPLAEALASIDRWSNPIRLLEDTLVDLLLDTCWKKTISPKLGRDQAQKRKRNRSNPSPKPLDLLRLVEHGLLAHPVTVSLGHADRPATLPEALDFIRGVQEPHLLAKTTLAALALGRCDEGSRPMPPQLYENLVSYLAGAGLYPHLDGIDLGGEG